MICLPIPSFSFFFPSHPWPPDTTSPSQFLFTGWAFILIFLLFRTCANAPWFVIAKTPVYTSALLFSLSSKNVFPSPLCLAYRCCRFALNLHFGQVYPCTPSLLPLFSLYSVPNFSFSCSTPKDVLDSHPPSFPFK